MRPKRVGNFPLVVALHGAGGEENFPHMHDLYPFIAKIFERISEAGYIVMSPDGRDGISADGSHTWGNDASTNTVSAAVAYARANLGATADPVRIFGTSMGSITGLNLWRRFSADVAAAVMVAGAVDLDYHHSGNDAVTGKYQAEIDTAYAGGYAAAAATHDPSTFAIADPGTYAALQMWHAVDDLVAPFDLSDDFAAALGADWHPLPSGGHTIAAWDFVDVDEIIDFLHAA
jgi:predicted peptidase